MSAMTAGALALGTPSPANAAGVQNPISLGFFGQKPPKKDPYFYLVRKGIIQNLPSMGGIKTGLFPTKDPTTGKMFLRVEDKTTGVLVDLDGQGNVIRITDPAATPTPRPRH